MLLLLADGTQLPVTELPGDGPWTFLVLQAGPLLAEVSPSTPAATPPSVDATPPSTDTAPPSTGPAPGPAAGALTRFGRAVVPDLRGRPGWGVPPGEPGFLDLVDDLDQVRTRAGLGRPVLVGLGALAPLALRAAADQPWAWRALVLVPPAANPPSDAELGQLDLPTLVLDAEPGGPAETAAVERLLGRLGEGPGWAGIAPEAPPR